MTYNVYCAVRDGGAQWEARVRRVLRQGCRFPVRARTARQADGAAEAALAQTGRLLSAPEGRYPCCSALRRFVFIWFRLENFSTSPNYLNTSVLKINPNVENRFCRFLSISYNDLKVGFDPNVLSRERDWQNVTFQILLIVIVKNVRNSFILSNVNRIQTKSKWLINSTMN